MNDLNKIDVHFQLIEIDCIKLKKTVTNLTRRICVKLKCLVMSM